MCWHRNMETQTCFNVKTCSCGCSTSWWIQPNSLEGRHWNKHNTVVILYESNRLCISCEFINSRTSKYNKNLSAYEMLSLKKYRTIDWYSKDISAEWIKIDDPKLALESTRRGNKKTWSQRTWAQKVENCMTRKQTNSRVPKVGKGNKGSSWFLF